ncbi:hypothetical protein HK101_009953 [Irineochytrium annulatum]|nr:hypothetical protein HK101_009953 [Irineochytrium annulatum]
MSFPYGFDAYATAAGHVQRAVASAAGDGVEDEAVPDARGDADADALEAVEAGDATAGDAGAGAVAMGTADDCAIVVAAGEEDATAGAVVDATMTPGAITAAGAVGCTAGATGGFATTAGSVGTAATTDGDASAAAGEAFTSGTTGATNCRLWTMKRCVAWSPALTTLDLDASKVSAWSSMRTGDALTARATARTVMTRGATRIAGCRAFEFSRSVITFELESRNPRRQLFRMQAIVVKEWQNFKDLKVSTIPKPQPGPTEVLVKVHAIGLNFFDTLMVEGKYQIKPPFPFVPGAEVAGVVEAVGDRAKGFKVGDRVFGTGASGIGAYAEYITMAARPGGLFKIPPNLSFREAASLLMTYPTSYLGLVSRGNLQPGEICLIHAAAGGVGSAAIQIAKVIGATVIATAGSDEKCQVAKDLGADYTINYSKEKDWAAKVNEITGSIRKKKGADVIYDPVGTFIKDTSCIAFNGRILVVGFAGTKGIENVPANRLLLKGASLVGVFWGGTTINDVPTATKTWEGVFELFAKHGKKPVVYTQKYIGLDSIVSALDDLFTRKSYGKVVVELGNAAKL